MEYVKDIRVHGLDEGERCSEKKFPGLPDVDWRRGGASSSLIMGSFLLVGCLEGHAPDAGPGLAQSATDQCGRGWDS